MGGVVGGIVDQGVGFQETSVTKLCKDSELVGAYLVVPRRYKIS